MAKFRHNITPEVYILDYDPDKSAGYLTDKDINRNIKNTIKLMGSCILYLNGIRKLSIYCQLPDLVEKIFNGYPTTSYPKPMFNAKLDYKYTRQCLNHYMVILNHGYSACREYDKRNNKEHKLMETMEWYITNIPDVLPEVEKPIPYPVRTLPARYRKKDLVDSMRSLYIMKYRPISLQVYKRVSVPEWFNLTVNDVILDS